ncbi:hypothetical protein A5760_09520 [Mycobacterium colombiense]|uniref:Uncharacterized protein n=1 Tax=Mycobacterium colombiense TaxID=339268 RepID=A0A1A0VLE7_9MYCO|nr:hypothetical protein [Mycobacterium colombiense]OBB84021.1 hypothetical protein A5760_09520 [Mycobacterium colombiense]
MAGGGAKGGWGRVLRYSFAGFLCLVAGINVLVGSTWYLPLGVAVTGTTILVGGQRRIFRAGVSRNGDEIVCRYIPWYEGNAYIALVLVPLLGVTSLAAGYAPGNPAWLRFTGILILGVTPLTGYGIVRMWRRCLLRITRTALTVRLAERKSELTEIRRELVESIEPKLIPQPRGGHSLQVGIAYRPVDAGGDTAKTVMLGLRLTVQPVNLVNALIAWRDGARDDPSDLLDRIEGILRASPTTGV